MPKNDCNHEFNQSYMQPTCMLCLWTKREIEFKKENAKLKSSNEILVSDQGHHQKEMMGNRAQMLKDFKEIMLLKKERAGLKNYLDFQGIEEDYEHFIKKGG